MIVYDTKSRKHLLFDSVLYSNSIHSTLPPLPFNLLHMYVCFVVILFLFVAQCISLEAMSMTIIWEVNCHRGRQSWRLRTLMSVFFECYSVFTYLFVVICISMASLERCHNQCHRWECCMLLWSCSFVFFVVKVYIGCEKVDSSEQVGWLGTVIAHDINRLVSQTLRVFFLVILF
jgi:hypothetical protein